MKDIYLKMTEMFETNRFSVLATIIRQEGPSPRGLGTKFLILDDGSAVGSIGGGILEAQVIEESEKVFAGRLPVRLQRTLKGSEVEDTDMLCGGDVEIFLEPVSPDNLNHLQIFKKIMEIIRRGGSGLLATVINSDRWWAGQIPKMFLNSDGEGIGSLLGIKEIEEILLERMDQLLNERIAKNVICRDEEQNRLELFVEPVVSDPILYLFGGGHISLQIVSFASRVGFKVVVIDDRHEFATSERFPEAAEVHCCPFDGVMDKLQVNESSYLVIITRGHTHDKTVLAQTLKTRAKYIGMIGSRRKISIIFDRLLEEGFTREEIDQVCSPIGIEIGAETPEEIALSIVAELIKVRAGA